MEVNSILIDREQQVEIRLVGSLRRKTEIDRMLEGIGSCTFDEVMRALIRHFR